MLSLPWIITFGPLEEDEDWEPVVCGPYERDHALSLAESVVADEELMAVVEPLMPHTSVDEIAGEIAAARLAGSEAEDDEIEEFDEFEDDVAGYVGDDEDSEGEESEETVEPTPPPSPEEVRAGFARIAARLQSV
jgi:hypothetical protein